MKKFLLFAGFPYDAGGGWCDFISDFNTIKEAEKIIHAVDNKGRKYGWAHIVNTETKEVKYYNQLIFL